MVLVNVVVVVLDVAGSLKLGFFGLSPIAVVVELYLGRELGLLRRDVSWYGSLSVVHLLSCVHGCGEGSVRGSWVFVC